MALRIGQVHRASAAGVACRLASVIVFLYPPFEIGGDAGVVSATTTLHDVDKPWRIVVEGFLCIHRAILTSFTRFWCLCGYSASC